MLKSNISEVCNHKYTNISDVYNHKYTKIKINSDDDLPLEIGIKILNMYNVVVLIKSIFNKYHNHYYYQKFLEKCSYK